MTRVIILGGGVAGMSAAHELAERGFEVTVLERRRIAGGKARSIPVFDGGPDTGGRELVDDGVDSLTDKLPGEHGFRFFPGFYKHIIDTLRKIPSFDGRAAADHLVATTRVGITQYNHPTFEVPAMFPRTPRDFGALLRDVVLLFGPTLEVTPEEFAFFTARFWQLLTTCEARRLAEYERTSWWEFIGAEDRSPAYRMFLAVGFTRSLVASRADKASARTVGDMFVQMMMTLLNPTAGTTDRVLDGPTNLVWIDPWLTWLKDHSVNYVFEAEIERLLFYNGRVQGVEVRRNGRLETHIGDYFISALPIERIAPMVTPAMIVADPQLGNLKALAQNVEWMNGLQFYLKRDLPLSHGHMIHVQTPWALTSISQMQFWKTLSAEHFGDKAVRGVLSIDVSNWVSPGGNGKPAMQCSREEVVRETWDQLKRSINAGGEILRDEDLHSWFLDPDIEADSARPGYLKNSEPLLVNLENTWELRPEAVTKIPNFFLASDYVKTFTDLATMEGANEAARRAVNGLLDAEGWAGERCQIWPLHEPEPLAPWRLYDAERFKAGLPWDSTLTDVAAQALKGSGVFDQIRPLLNTIEPFVLPFAAAIDPPRPPPGPDGRGQDEGPLAALQERIENFPNVAPAPGGLVGPGGFVERMIWYREMIDDALIKAVPRSEPRKHLYDLVDDFLGRSGKGLRPAFCLATARALGGEAANAAPAAAGLEMLHNAFLVHDDIEDESESRRGAPTMHRRAGVPIAVNTGDAMNALSMRLFRQTGERIGPIGAQRLLDEVDHMIVETFEGQALELGWMRDNDLGVKAEDYLNLVLKKTAWYSFIHPMRIGALAANPEDDNLGRFDGFGFLVGLAFQITDDVLNLTGDQSRYGKEIDGDLWEGKRTLMLTHALAHAGPADKLFIGNFLERRRERRLPREVLRLREIIDRAGSIAWARACADACVTAAERQFDIAFAGAQAGPDLDWLRNSVAFVARRDK